MREKSDRRLFVVVVGSLPPPVGGVNSSVRSLYEATLDNKDICVELLSWKKIWGVIFKRPDVLHFHFSRPLKRALASIFSKILGIKVIHTIHSNNFEFNSILNRISLRISSGFILLNSDIYERFSGRVTASCVLMTPIFSTEEVRPAGTLDNALGDWISSRKSSVAAVYSYDRREQDGYDLYGFTFISRLLPVFEKMGWSIIFLDPHANYRSDELFPSDCSNAFLQSSRVDFKNMLNLIDMYVRPTSTDGNSVAVLEALSVGVPVLASDIVPRPGGVVTYRFNDPEDFLQKFSATSLESANGSYSDLTTIDEYVKFVRQLFL